MERRQRRDREQVTKKKREREEREERKDERKGKRRKRENGEGRRREMGKASKRDCISIITVDWLGLRATSYLLVFPFYITTNLLLISYY